jgi:hypothetical protein
MNTDTPDNPIYHIVFLKRAVPVARRPGADWRALQGEFLDYKTSLGSWAMAQVTAWLSEEYGPDAERAADLAAFVNAKESLLSV